MRFPVYSFPWKGALAAASPNVCPAVRAPSQRFSRPLPTQPSPRLRDWFGFGEDSRQTDFPSVTKYQATFFPRVLSLTLAHPKAAYRGQCGIVLFLSHTVSSSLSVPVIRVTLVCRTEPDPAQSHTMGNAASHEERGTSVSTTTPVNTPTKWTGAEPPGKTHSMALPEPDSRTLDENDTLPNSSNEETISEELHSRHDWIDAPGVSYAPTSARSATTHTLNTADEETQSSYFDYTYSSHTNDASLGTEPVSTTEINNLDTWTTGTVWPPKSLHDDDELTAMTDMARVDDHDDAMDHERQAQRRRRPVRMFAHTIDTTPSDDDDPEHDGSGYRDEVELVHEQSLAIESDTSNEDAGYYGEEGTEDTGDENESGGPVTVIVQVPVHTDDDETHSARAGRETVAAASGTTGSTAVPSGEHLADITTWIPHENTKLPNGTMTEAASGRVVEQTTIYTARVQTESSPPEAMTAVEIVTSDAAGPDFSTLAGPEVCDTVNPHSAVESTKESHDLARVDTSFDSTIEVEFRKIISTESTTSRPESWQSPHKTTASATSPESSSPQHVVTFKDTEHSVADTELQFVSDSDGEEIDLIFVEKYEDAFATFLEHYPELAKKNPELMENLRVAKLQRLLEITLEAENALVAQLRAAEEEKRIMANSYHVRLIEASRLKAAREIQLQQEVRDIQEAARVLEGKMNWQVVSKNESRVKKHQLLVKQFQEPVEPSNLIVTLPDFPETQAVRDAVAAPPGTYLSEAKESDLRQFQVDNAFLTSEVTVLERKLANQLVAVKKHAWVDSVLLQMDGKQMKRLKHRYQKKLGTAF